MGASPLFEGGWICAGRLDDVLAPSSQKAVVVGNTGVLLVRDHAGELRAFANICRHRGHELLACGAAVSRRVVQSRTTHGATNSTVACENYHECYHCPLIHPELCRVSPPDSGDNIDDVSGAFVGGSMELAPHASTMSLDGRSGGDAIAGLPSTLHRQVRYVNLLPNLLLSLHPDYVMTHRIQPVTPTTSRVECQWLFDPASVARPDFDPGYAVDFWDLTNRQDWAAVESVQRGLASPRFVPGVFAEAEVAVYHFATALASAYLGGPLLRRSASNATH